MRAIDRYAAIGDGRSVALVSDQGAIEWLCWPRVDSDAVFAALIDERGGAIRVAPAESFTASRRYLEGTNVLATTMRTGTGAIEVIDWMPAADETDKRMWPEREILRRVRCVEGRVDVAVEVDPRPGFGRARARASRTDPLGIRWDTAHGAFYARCDARLDLHGARASTTVPLSAGGRLDLSFAHALDGPAVLPALGPRVDEDLARTTAWWRAWAARARHTGPLHEHTVRSALALKLMCHAPTGAILAAPTTSLPERLGGPLNWDYRFCWLRDASLTARALFGLGYNEEAVAFVSWLLHATRLSWPKLDVLYDVYGRTPPRERELGHLDGYFGARPVRVGNAAHHQLQLDLYGEVIDAAAQLARHCCRALDHETQELLIGLGTQALRTWHLPDQGIWEPRAEAVHHTHSRLLCWVAVDRMIDLHQGGHVALPDRGKWEAARAAIRRDIEERAWSERLRSYVGVLDRDDETALDATTLLLSWYGFEQPDSPRMCATWERLRATLGTKRGFRRYLAEPGWEEGAFGMCGFWAVEHLARTGAQDEAEQMFVEMLGTANDVGLFSEEIDPDTGVLLGNFPQAFTHVGAINAAITLAERRPSRRSAPRPARTTPRPARSSHPSHPSRPSRPSRKKVFG